MKLRRDTRPSDGASEWQGGIRILSAPSPADTVVCVRQFMVGDYLVAVGDQCRKDHPVAVAYPAYFKPLKNEGAST
jgi:hypothetical protein